ncbi:uncharacterized protein SPSK_06687 [Sporothrix schenckii 1099-18]|uniref:Uncharacterized protein n=1 Tax=Sporothrix schenckii 1099-18 TaxID=1397361 RepID=A0A0F2MLW6_SPOSC|nr:uncharacterized protein SPSK_06687 [Sporothrix schenckii 1099-18]KJR89176.1 hypothetical protein SPSK_06687 [Sporothrix schenckii 1099-18]
MNKKTGAAATRQQERAVGSPGTVEEQATAGGCSTCLSGAVANAASERKSRCAQIVGPIGYSLVHGLGDSAHEHGTAAKWMNTGRSPHRVYQGAKPSQSRRKQILHQILVVFTFVGAGINREWLSRFVVVENVEKRDSKMER